MSGRLGESTAQMGADSRHYGERMPRWLLRPVRTGAGMAQVRSVLDTYGLHTVCRSARCPNHGECFASRTATFMILGDVCTRHCTFCAVGKGTPAALEVDEPERVARAAAELGLRHLVVTSVTRDDLPDGGAGHFAATIRAARSQLPEAAIEVLTPDFGGDRAAVRVVLEAGPDVFNHNLETVVGLYTKVRPQADYARSLELLRFAADEFPGIRTKSGLMVGLGETREELKHTFGDLHEAGCHILTLGQYLRPTRANIETERFYTPAEFEELEVAAREAGIPQVFAGPLVRSSYHAGDVFEDLRD